MHNMEALCNAVKESECWDFQNDECKDIAEAVDKMLNRLVDYMHEDYPNIRVSRLVRGGSMEEKTRLLRTVEQYSIGRKVEFDYLAVIEKWPDIGPLRFKPSCPGYMKLECDVGDPNLGSDDKRYLKVSCTRLMIENMMKCVTTRCEQNFCTHGQTFDRSGEGCSACSVYLKTGNLTVSSMWYFHWIPKVDITTDNYKSCLGTDFMFAETKTCSLLPSPNCGPIVIVVDFNPVFELDRANIVEDSLKPIDLPSDSKDSIYLFPKNGKTCSRHCMSDCCWRISTIAHELALIKSTTSEHRYAYMTLKFLTTILFECTWSYMFDKNMRSLTKVNPYTIKTIFFNHVDKCQQPGLDMKDCVSEMLTDLQNSYRKRELAHFYLKYNIYTTSHEEYYQQKKFIFLSTCLKTVWHSSSARSDMGELAMDLISLHFILPVFNYRNDSGLNSDSDLICNQFMKRRETCSAEETLKITAWEFKKDGRDEFCQLLEAGSLGPVPILQRLHEYFEVKENGNEEVEERKKEENKEKERDTDKDRETDEQKPTERP